MIKQNTALTLVVIAFSFAQSVLAQVSGSSTNLCPKTGGYTYKSADGCGGANGSSWVITGGTKISSGNTSSLGDYVVVSWDNVSTGTVHNDCGTLNVTINSIAQPTLPSLTQVLCGSGSIQLQASVSSTANITGYIWDVRGTGVTPGTYSTTTPQFNLNYSNWGAGSSNSATVAVGAVNSNCSYATAVTPLTNQTIGGTFIHAIPDNAWVQLSPGNINNLLVSYTFNPLVICSSGATMQITNQPAGTSLSWSSGNPSGLSITSSGVATRMNNFNGGVPISATVSNSCGSHTESAVVWLGPPNGIVNIENEIPGYFSNSELYKFALDPPGYFTGQWSVTGGYIAGGGGDYALVQFTVLNDYASVTVTPSNACGASEMEMDVFVGQQGCPPGDICPNAIVAFPNPVSDKLNVQLAVSPNSKASSFGSLFDNTKAVGDVHEVSIKLVNENNVVVKSGATVNGKIAFDTNDLPQGIYYLRIFNRGNVINEKQILVKR